VRGRGGRGRVAGCRVEILNFEMEMRFKIDDGIRREDQRNKGERRKGQEELERSGDVPE